MTSQTFIAGSACRRLGCLALADVLSKGDEQPVKDGSPLHQLLSLQADCNLLKSKSLNCL